MNDCRRAEESLAAGEPATAWLADHLARCASCTALARDVERLHGAAATLPRPAVALRPGRARAASRGWLLPAAAAAVVALLAITLGQPWSRRAPAVGDAPAGDVDVYAVIEQASSVWGGATSTESGATDSSSTADEESGSDSSVDPLASLQPAAVLAAAARQEAVSKPRRNP